jgi:hypothetical protein
MGYNLYDLLGTGFSDDQILELHEVPRDIFDSRFDKFIDEAAGLRGYKCVGLGQT